MGLTDVTHTLRACDDSYIFHIKTISKTSGTMKVEYYVEMKSAKQLAIEEIKRQPFFT